METKLPSLAESIQKVLQQIPEPIKLDDFIKKVLEIRPSSAKNPKAGIRSHLRTEEEGKSFVLLYKETIIPLRLGAPGVRFRIPLSRWEVNNCALPIYPAFHSWISYIDEKKALNLIDEQGTPLPVDVVSLKYRVSGFRGDFDVAAFKMSRWFQKYKMRRNDSILVTIESWEPRRFRLEFEPEKKRRSHS
ncbi:MAG: hypothetical protein JXB23_01190 [Candidatus Aminicenantes bacterium]|nr:hypothetical protein [Candidatus Aminicenantes bacterium]